MACSSSTPTNCKTFPSAEQARDQSLCPDIIWTEIHAIQNAILAAIKACQLSVIVSDGTPITSNNSISGITVNDGGTGYTSVSATAVITHPTGTGADLVPIATTGAVTGFTINSGGTGYTPIEATADASGTGGGDAVFQVAVSATGTIENVFVLAGGTGYTPGDAITIVHPTGTGATVEVATIGSGGVVLSTVVVAAGSGYETINPTISITHPSGAGFVGTVLQNSGTITGISITAGGSGYQDLDPTIDITTSTGIGATFQINATAGVITTVDVLTGGAGYATTDTVDVIPVPGTGGTGADLSLTVTTVSSTLDPVLYFNVWSDLSTDRLIDAQLAFIVNYFTCLGYNFQIQTNPATGNTIQWSVIW